MVPSGETLQIQSIQPLIDGNVTPQFSFVPPSEMFLSLKASPKSKYHWVGMLWS